MPPTNRGHWDRTAVLRDLATAAHPYGLRVEPSAHSTLPDLVFLRPSDGAELGRLRFFEPESGDPFMRTIILNEVARAEQQQLETHLAAALLPLVTRVFSYSLWMGLADCSLDEAPASAASRRSPTERTSASARR